MGNKKDIRENLEGNWSDVFGRINPTKEPNISHPFFVNEVHELDGQGRIIKQIRNYNDGTDSHVFEKTITWGATDTTFSPWVKTT